MGKIVKYGNGMAFVNDSDTYTRMSVNDEFNEVTIELMYGKVGGISMRHNLSHSDVAELYLWLTGWIDSFQQDEQGDV